MRPPHALLTVCMLPIYSWLLVAHLDSPCHEQERDQEAGSVESIEVGHKSSWHNHSDTSWVVEQDMSFVLHKCQM